MTVYLLYLKSTVTTQFTKPVLFSKISQAVQEILFTREYIEIIPIMCKSIGNYDIRVDIKANLTLSLEQETELAKRIEFAVKEDQNAYIKSFRTVVKMNPDADYNHKIASDNSDNDELDYQKRAENFSAVDPEYTFERVILPESVRERIDEALNIFKYQSKVFDEWGLREIEPHPSSSLSFYGPSGTGKTMAAEAIASKLGKMILRVSYADIESKFHGEGPKMVKAIFYEAERDNAVLFIDEADSLLSKRLTNVSSGSDQAINSMRSQLLISLERFEGIVIFAKNLVVNYDQAFLTRLISVEFVKPDEEARKKIWQVHMKPTGNSNLNIPLSSDVNIDELSAKYDFCGREIKKAVISACIKAAVNQQTCVNQSDLVRACDKIVEEEESLKKASDYTDSRIKPVSPETKATVHKAIVQKIAEGATSVDTPQEDNPSSLLPV